MEGSKIIERGKKQEVSKTGGAMSHFIEYIQHQKKLVVAKCAYNRG